MKLYEIKNFVNYIADKEDSGYTLTPEEYSMVIKFVNQEFFNIEYSKYEVTHLISDNLRPFEVVMGGQSVPLRVTNGYATLPNDYMHYSSLWYKKAVGSTGLNTIENTVIEILKDSQFAFRKSSKIIDSTKYPASTIRNGQIEFIPNTIDFIEFTYLKTPTDPFYDYYISVEGEEIPLAVGEVHTWVKDETDSSGNLKKVTDPPYTSQTVELEFPDNTHIMICRMLLSKIGINLKDQAVLEYSMAFQQQGGNE